MAFPRVLFAGDSNLKFVPWFVPSTEREQLKIVTVSGASVVRDVTGFRGYLEEAVRNFRPEELYLHLGSNDISRRTSARRVYWELRQLIGDLREIVPDVRVKLCSVLPRSRSVYRDERWNSIVLSEIQNGVYLMNRLLQELCDEQGCDFVLYNLQPHHFGLDGLHVRPAGAKHLLFTILGKVKSKCFLPVTTTPCSQKTVPCDLDTKPALPSSNPTLNQQADVAQIPKSVVLTPKKNKDKPVTMPYARVPCNVSFGWDDNDEPVTMPYARVPCNVSFGWDDNDKEEISRTISVSDEEPSPVPNEKLKSEGTMITVVRDQWKEQLCSGKMYTEKELQSKGMMKLSMFGVDSYVKPSAFGIKNGLLGGAKNSKKPSANPGKTKRLNPDATREFLMMVCTTRNERNLKPDGPYGDVCGLLSGLSNSKKNRKRLQTLWFRLKKCSTGEGKRTHMKEVGEKTKRVTRSTCKSVGKSYHEVSTSRNNKDIYDVPMKDIEYIAIGRVLKDMINSENVSCLGDLGPYGVACRILGWESLPSNKLLLYTIWKENRGNVRDDIDNHVSYLNKGNNDTGNSEPNFSSKANDIQATRYTKIYIQQSKNNETDTLLHENKNNMSAYNFKEVGDNNENSEKIEDTVLSKTLETEKEFEPEKNKIKNTISRNVSKGNDKFAFSSYLKREKSHIKGCSKKDINNFNKPKISINDNIVEQHSDEKFKLGEWSLQLDGMKMSTNKKMPDKVSNLHEDCIQDIHHNLAGQHMDTNGCLLQIEKNNNVENPPKEYEKQSNNSTVSTDINESDDSYDSDSTLPYSDETCNAPAITKGTVVNIKQSTTDDKAVTSCSKQGFENNISEFEKLMSNIPFNHEEVESPKKLYRSNVSPKPKFDDQCWDEKLREKDTKSILKMLETFFSDKESLQSSTCAKLLEIYKSSKSQIGSFKKFSEIDIDVDKEYKIREEMFMQNLFTLDSLLCTPEFKYIKKSLVYINNCALSSLDGLYKKTKNKATQNEKQENTNFLKTDKFNKFNTLDKKSSYDFSIDNFSDDLDKGPLSKETISSILEMEIPDKYFTKEIPQFASFKIDENNMKTLLLNRTKRAFKRDSWESLFFRKIKESNPYCCFQVTSSRLSTATRRKRKTGSPFFLVHAKCTFIDCSIHLKLEMHNKSMVNVVYTGHLKHNIQEVRYRPIKGDDRNQLKNEFKGGLKPMAHYLDRLQQLPTENLVSGNRDGLGKNSRVFAQIAAESRQGGRMDENVFQSLQELKEEMNKKIEGGFIQKICASPCYILYWSKFGIELYNERAKKDALYWDATGSVVRKQEDGKQFLYYELAIRNPIKGKMGIPLTAMITNDQSLSTILDWLRCFRQAEKQKFGHNSKKIVTFPKMIVIDQAMVFILAALKEFNGENLDDFLSRAWHIVFGKANVDDTSKTIVHLCASHFMHTAKLYLKKKDIAGHKLKMFLYMIGLLMNCTKIHDAQELLSDIYMTLGSNTIHSENKKFYDRLLRKINDFNCVADNEIVDTVDEIQEKSQSINPGRFTEEEFQVLGSASPFKDWNYKIMSKAQIDISDMSEMKVNDLFINPLYSLTFIEYLSKRIMPLYPLWGSLLMGDLTRYNDNYNPLMKKENDCLFNSINNVGKTNSTIENRFRILKDICLGGRTQHRLDEFSERLKTSTIGIQKLVALDCLKYPSLIKSMSKRQTSTMKRKVVGSCSKKNKKQKTLVHEQWNKARPQPENLKAKLGKYQQAPQEEIKLKHTPVKRKCDTDFNVSEGVSPIKTRCHNKPTNTDRNNKFKNENLKSFKQAHITSQFCGLSNFGNSCWLNSVLQALAYCQMSTSVIESKDLSIDLTGSEPSNSEIAVHDIIEVWKYMKDQRFFGTQVPDKILRSVFRSVVAAIPGFSLRQQQDAHEFNSNIIADMANSLRDNSLEYHFTEECTHCKKARIRETNVGQSIVLDIEGKDKVSVQTLISNFFLGDSTFRKCNSCKNETEHTTKQKFITKFPKTLMIVIRRYKIQYLENRKIVSKKLHNNIHVSSELSLTDQKDFQVNYKLKSTVCHHGNGTSAGHYNAVIKHDDDYVCCDDKNISLVDCDYTLSTAYLVIYDRVDPPLPVYVKPFINCWRLTRGVIEVLKVMKPNPLFKGKTNLLEDIHENGITESVDAYIRKSLSLDLLMNNISEVDFYSKLIKFLTQTDEGSEILFRDNFTVSTNHIRLCQNCGLVDTQCQNLLTLSVKEFSVHSVHNCLTQLQGERVIRMCRCGSKSDVFIMSLPSTLVINIDECCRLNYEDIQTLVISNDLREAYPIGSRKYHLKSMYRHKNGYFLSCIKKGSCLIPMLNDKEVRNFAGFNKVILFFDRENCMYDHEKEVMHMLKKNELSGQPFLKIPKQINNDIKNQTDNSLFGVKLSKDFFSTLLDTSAWLSSDHVNVYLSLLARETSLKVHSVNSVWYSQRMVKDSDPQRLQWVFHETESKVKWFDYDYILIPINENGSHWTIAITHIKEKQIIFCNSLSVGNNESITCHQVWRYLCYEALFHSGLLLKKNEWSILHYHDFPGFPMQTDGSSCGVYICAVAKSIIFKQMLPQESNLLSFRKCIANEISTLSLCL